MSCSVLYGVITAVIPALFLHFKADEALATRAAQKPILVKPASDLPCKNYRAESA